MTLQSDLSAVIETVSGTAKIKELDDGRAIVVKQIPAGATLEIEDNDGTISVLRNEGTLVVKDNDDIVSVDENLGSVVVNQNDDTIVIHKNLRRDGKVGAIQINSNGTGSPGEDLVRVYDNFGAISTGSAGDGKIFVKNISGAYDIGKNNLERKQHSESVNCTKTTCKPSICRHRLNSCRLKTYLFLTFWIVSKQMFDALSANNIGHRA